MSSRLLQTAQRVQLYAALVVASLSLIFWEAGALSVLCGGIVMAGNFWFLRTLMQRVFVGQSQSAKLVYGLLLGSKLFVVLGVVSFLVITVKMNAVGLAVGMGTFFFGVAGAMVLHRGELTPSHS